MLKSDGYSCLVALTSVIALFQTIRGQLEISAQEADMLPKQAAKCNDFVLGNGFQDGQYVFQSPNYPQKYPNSTDCIKLIQAPNPAQVIKVDFPDKFIMEVTGDKCEYDYLEIRDGPYGFSPPLRGGRFCGKKPPQAQSIISSTRYLWLRFHADDSIEHMGFRGVFEFVTPQVAVKTEPECRIIQRLNSGQLIYTENNLLDLIPRSKTAEPHDCTLDFVAPSDAKLVIHFESLLLSKDGDCNSNYLKVYDGFTISETSLLSRTPKICRAGDVGGIITSTHRRVVLQVFGQNRLDLPQFTVVVTILYTEKMCKKPLPRGYFDCGAHQCIVDAPTFEQSLVCNGHANCPNEVDEEACVRGKKLHSHANSKNMANVRQTESTLTSNNANEKKKDEIDYHSIILGVIGGLLFIFVAICIFITVRHRRAEIRNQNRKEARQRAIAQLKEDAANSSMTPLAAWTASGSLNTPLEINELQSINSALFVDNHSSSRQYKQNGFGHASSAYPYNRSQSVQTPSNSKPNTPSSRRKTQDSLQNHHHQPLPLYDQQHREDVIIHTSLPRVGRYLAAPSSSMDENILDSPIQPIANRSGSSPYLGASLIPQTSSLPYQCRIHSSKQQAFPLPHATQISSIHQGYNLVRESNHDVIMPPPPPPPLLRRAEALSMEFYPPNNNWQ